MSKDKNTISVSKTILALNDNTGEIFLGSNEQINIVIDGSPPGSGFDGTVDFEVRYPNETAAEYHLIESFTAQKTKLAIIKTDGFYRLNCSAFVAGPIIGQFRGK